MDLITETLVAIFFAVLAGSIAFATIDSKFPEFSKRSKERISAANAKEKDSFLKTISKAGNRLSKLLPVKAEDEAAYLDKLARAGLKLAPQTWHGIQMLSSIAIGSVFSLLLVFSSDLDLPFKVLTAAALFAAGWLFPSIILWALAKQRSEDIDKELPSMLELLALSVKAGYPLAHGIKLVGKVGTGELANEFRTVDADINLLGMDIERALSRMKSRCGSDAVSAFCSAVIQSQQQGTSITRILGSQAKLARNEQYARTMEKIKALSNKMTPIVILVFMPIVLVIILVPSVLQMAQQLSMF